MLSSNRRACLLALPALVALGAGCGRRQPRGRTLAAGATVVALGDSLTWGTGASTDTAWPAVLAARTGWRVINAGVPGHTSAQALERTPALLAEYRPQAVMLSIGGNDFLRRHPVAATRANIRRICELALQGSVQLLLIAVPQPSAAAAVVRSLSDHPLYRDLADELRIALHAGGWARVLSDPRLRADPIHANSEGHRRFVQELLPTLREAGWLSA